MKAFNTERETSAVALQYLCGGTGQRSGGETPHLGASPPGNPFSLAEPLLGVESTVPELRVTGF